MDAREIKRHIDTVERLRDNHIELVNEGCGGSSKHNDCRCSCHDLDSVNRPLEREQALTAALAAMRQVANVQ